MLGPEDQPEAVVERMLAAFNRHDVDGVIATYSPDIEFFVLGGERWAPGLEAWRKQNESMFESAPGLHCEVPDRIVQGNYVIAHEHLTSDADDMKSEEHTSELQSLMRTSYAVFCLKKNKRENIT